jgi:hypothetical protein
VSLPVLPVYKAVAALIGAATEKPVGMAKLPKVLVDGKPTEKADVPCTVLYVENPVTSGPGWGDADADAEMRFRARAVGGTADQVEWLVDRIRGAWLDKDPDDVKQFRVDLAIDGMSVMNREVKSESPVEPESDRVFSRSIVLCAYVTPADAPAP